MIKTTFANRRQVESAIVWRLALGPLDPRSVRSSMEEAGFCGDQVRNAVARMLDRGDVVCDRNLRIKLSPRLMEEWSREHATRKEDRS